VGLTPTMTHMQHTVGTIITSLCGTLIPWPNNNSNNSRTVVKLQVGHLELRDT
jgi:hypothetical protein